MVKWVSAAIGAIAVVLAIWFASPYVALRGIQQGVASNNADALSEHVDYTMLRANMKVRVGQYLTESLPANTPQLFKERVLSQTSGLVDKGVETYVTPEMLKRLMQAKPVQDSQQKDSVDIQRTWDVRWWTKRKSLDEVVLHVVSTNPKYEDREVLVHLRRVSGITWKVVDIDPASWKDWAMQRAKGAAGMGR